MVLLIIIIKIDLHSIQMSLAIQNDTYSAMKLNKLENNVKVVHAPNLTVYQISTFEELRSKLMESSNMRPTVLINQTLLVNTKWTLPAKPIQ